MGPDGVAVTERILLEPPAAAGPGGGNGSGDAAGRPLLRELVRDGVIVGREPLAAARSRHAAALAELPPYTLQLSRGYPAIPTKFGRDREEGLSPGPARASAARKTGPPGNTVAFGPGTG
jgi:hypothetical protein